MPNRTLESIKGQGRYHKRIQRVLVSPYVNYSNSGLRYKSQGTYEEYHKSRGFSKGTRGQEQQVTFVELWTKIKKKRKISLRHQISAFMEKPWTQGIKYAFDNEYSTIG